MGSWRTSAGWVGCRAGGGGTDLGGEPEICQALMTTTVTTAMTPRAPATIRVSIPRSP